MVSYLGQNLIGLTLVLGLVLVSAEVRPQYYEGNDLERIQPGLTYNPFYPYPGFSRYPESQYEKLRLLFEGQDNKAAGGSANAVEYREPESKRQAAVRYRQCYFNPISCFRK